MLDIVLWVAKDIQPGRLTESLIFLVVLLWKVKPHLKRIEERMAGVESSLNRIDHSMLEGFAMGEQRFQKIEKRISMLENKPQGEK